LRALGDCKFPMPFDTAGRAGNSLFDVAEIVPPWKKKI